MCAGSRAALVVALVLAACGDAEPARAPDVTPDAAPAVESAAAWEPDAAGLADPQVEMAELSAEGLRAFQTEIARLTRESLPAAGVSRAAIEARFGEGVPLPRVPSMLPQEAPPDSPRRRYDLLDDVALVIRYDDDWNVRDASFFNPGGIKNQVAGRERPLDVRGRGADRQLERLRRIRAELRGESETPAPAGDP